MNKRILFICEKPMIAERLSIIMNGNDNVILAQAIASYKFDYQSVSFSQSPYTQEEPLYKCNTDTKLSLFNTECWDSRGNHFENKILKIFLDLKNEGFSSREQGLQMVKEFFNQYDEIIYACDPDLTGYRSFYFKFKKYFNLGENWICFFEKINIKVTGMIYYALDEKSLKNSYKKRKPLKNNLFFQNLKDAYIKKDFFEYNYNLNSILFFNDALKDAGYIKTKDSKVLTKNYILTLFYISNNDDFFTHTFNEKMERNNIGRVVSRMVIIEDLLKMNIIEENINVSVVKNYPESKSHPERSKTYYAYKLTELGERFIENLHKKTNDPNLAIRLLQNNFTNINHLKGDKRKKANNLSVDDFKIKYEKYLYNTFSKQKRYLRKIKRDV